MATYTHLYGREEKDKEIVLDINALEALHDSQLLWVEIVGRDKAELEKVASVMGLRAESLSNISWAAPRPCVRNFGSYSRLNLLGVREAPGSERYEAVPIYIFAGRNYVVTLHLEESGFLDDFDEQVRGDSTIGELNVPSFLAALLDIHVNGYFRALEALNDRLDRFDAKALRRPLDPKLFPRILDLRHRIAVLRRLLIPHRELYSRMARPDFTSFYGPETASYMDALNERLEEVIDTLENTRDTVVGSIELLLALSSHSTNDSVKLLTLATVVEGTLAVISGIFGMNFTTGLFNAGDAGFLLTIGVMVLIIAISVIVARRKYWL